ncbi:MAG: 4Fe-4S dicluster domain-containing protein [Sulfolobales archaeon]|nr:4Fe-4S dicluster domain-containing protein [Sulfolobales archaeon]MCX8208452.1 4Fe-4S dicluster domain-containing protein [Sulfolobales archaeon]MDW8010102.1 4Fe-4S dicluster domain-containing protein [Sulfolobales archaeon]
MPNSSFRKTGVVSPEELAALNLLPPEDRLKKGPVVVLECPEMIPCNICVPYCPTKAIKMEKLIDIPAVEWDKCIGCGICVAVCPGLAAFVVDTSKSDFDYVTVPHEFIPIPRVGDEVVLLNKLGEGVGRGVVVRVWERNRTYVITVRVPKGLGMEVRAVWVER